MVRIRINYGPTGYNHAVIGAVVTLQRQKIWTYLHVERQSFVV